MGCTARCYHHALIRWWFVGFPCLNKFFWVRPHSSEWGRGPSTASINQLYCSWLWVWPQQSTSAPSCCCLRSSSCQCWHKTGQNLRHPTPTPTPTPPAHRHPVGFISNPPRLPPCSDLRCRAPSTHPQNSTSQWQLNAGFWIRKSIPVTDSWGKEKKVIQYFKIQSSRCWDFCL